MGANIFEWIYHKSYNQKSKLQFYLVVPYVTLTLILLKKKNLLLKQKAKQERKKRKERRGEKREGKEVVL